MKEKDMNNACNEKRRVPATKLSLPMAFWIPLSVLWAECQLALAWLHLDTSMWLFCWRSRASSWTLLCHVMSIISPVDKDHVANKPFSHRFFGIFYNFMIMRWVSCTWMTRFMWTICRRKNFLWRLMSCQEACYAFRKLAENRSDMCSVWRKLTWIEDAIHWYTVRQFAMWC